MRIHAAHPLSQMSFVALVGLDMVTSTSSSIGPSGASLALREAVGTNLAAADIASPASSPRGAAFTLTGTVWTFFGSRRDRTVITAEPSPVATTRAEPALS